MDLQSSTSNSSATHLENVFNQILVSIQDALASQMRTTPDLSGSIGETLSDFSDYLVQVEVERSTSPNPQTDAGLIFDRSNLVSVHELLKGFLDLDRSSLNTDYTESVPMLSICYDRIQEILSDAALESDTTNGAQATSENAQASPTSLAHDLAGLGSWLQTPPTQDEIDTTSDGDPPYNADFGFTSYINSDSALHYECIAAASSSDVDEAYSTMADEFSGMSIQRSRSCSSEGEAEY